ncbi:hypothetical protein E3N88_38365 [Mikania micrantha]|uniref:PGG domain-containing protein n=1 Tax=Mikania micrantha TaxID=192012 RepID=A0A5N6LTP8_9ASTR|nr:hypothetical protein E3N88_38316 [Mikania micrantha]KAD2804988.1 hypothetical protein E3N88_38365 [Mikania micrantha]
MLERTEDYLDIGVPLYKAAITSDWNTANNIILDSRNRRLEGFSVSNENMSTTLHVAVTANETERSILFVRNLVNIMFPNELEVVDAKKNTAFCLVCMNGNMEMGMIMLRMNIRLLHIRGTDGMMPLQISSLFGRYKLLRFLYDSSRNNTDQYDDEDWKSTLSNCVENDLFGK